MSSASKEIEAVNAQMAPFRVLSGIEVDILADGSLALPDDVLAALDVVVASPHTALRQSSEIMTARLLSAIRNPHVDVIGHPTGVLIGDREPAQMDFTAIVAAAAQHGVALEINANPARLDLDDVHARQAAAAGVLLCINTDAHRMEMLQHMVFGVAMARRGWCEARNVLNTRSLDGADCRRGWRGGSSASIVHR